MKRCRIRCGGDNDALSRLVRCGGLEVWLRGVVRYDGVVAGVLVLDGVAVTDAILLVYNLILLAGTAYLVGWRGWSAWWFALAVCLLATGRD